MSEWMNEQLIGFYFRAGLNIRPYAPTRTYVRHSVHKNFSDLNEIWYVGKGRWVIHECRMTRSKVKITDVWNVRKWRISTAIPPLVYMHVIKRLTVNYDTPRQYLNFNLTKFWYSSHPRSASCDLQTSGVSAKQYISHQQTPIKKDFPIL